MVPEAGYKPQPTAFFGGWCTACDRREGFDFPVRCVCVCATGGFFSPQGISEFPSRKHKTNPKRLTKAMAQPGGRCPGWSKVPSMRP